MPDFSVYITVKNNTNEFFVHGEKSEDYGEWTIFTDTIAPHASAELQIKDKTGPAGTEGTFSYKIRGARNETTFKAYQTDPYAGDNQIEIKSRPDPLAVYACSFRARSGSDGQWTDNSVSTSGHPVYVEYTIGYQRKQHFRFQLIQIRANSNHPVRNTRKELIVGNHILWSNSNPSIYADGTSGSFQPNVFAYKFNSQVAESGILDVTVRPLDLELIGAEVILFGTRYGKRIIQSDYFFFRNLDNVTVPAHVVDPKESAGPFSLNADVDWGMELRLSKQGLQRVGQGITRLELYWIATTLHRAFKTYIPVTFLRNVLPIQATAQLEPATTTSEFYEQTTRRVFNDYHKRYDSVAGMSAFGLNAQGGIFNQNFYFLADDISRQPGTGYPFVNCMDQAAMLELSCSFFGGFASTSWLFQKPFGYINTTHLVGVKDAAGALMNVNNPFFGTDRNLANLPINDHNRDPFSLHVYIGHSKPLNPDDGIYDACGGPHLGNETIAQFITNSIDTQTTLYQTNPRAGPGTVANVDVGAGVVGVDGQLINPSSRIMSPLTEPLSRLVNTAVANTVGPIAHVGWAHLPIWLNTTLGDAWKVRYEQVSVNETGTQALWLISNTNAPNDPIRVHVNVVSAIGEDGNFDMERSAIIVKEDVGNILMSTERQNIWTSGTLPGIEGVSLRYVDHIAAGRIVLVAGNVVMDIAGMTSYEELLPYALKLLNQTVRHDLGPLNRSPPIIPVIQRQAIRIGTDTSDTTTVREPEAGTDIITVTGIDTRFSLVFTVNCKIATANAGSEGYGILFDRHIVEELEQGGGCTVEFLFVAREIGHHRVRVYVANLDTMIAANLELEVEVVGAEEKVESESGQPSETMIGVNSDLEAEVVGAEEKVPESDQPLE